MAPARGARRGANSRRTAAPRANGVQTKSSPSSLEDKREIKCNEAILHCKPDTPAGFTLHQTDSLLREMRDAPDHPFQSLLEFEVFANARLYRPERTIAAGKIRAQEALDEWDRACTARATELSSDREAEEKEMGWAPTDPIKLHEERTKRQRLSPAFQRITPFPADPSEIEEVERPVLETFPPIEESNIRIEVAPHENKAVKDAYGNDKMIEGIDMEALSDPFEDPRSHKDGVYTLLQCVRFYGNPAVKTTKWRQGLAMANLPYPLREVPFLEQFVKPLFLADDWVSCDYCRTKFAFRELSIVNWEAGIDGRIARCTAIGDRVLAVVDAMQREWDALFEEVKPVEAMPIATYFLCRAVDVALREKIRGEGKEHGCPFWRLCREVALLRAHRWMEEQLKAKPIIASDLPMPFDEEAAAR